MQFDPYADPPEFTSPGPAQGPPQSSPPTLPARPALHPSASHVGTNPPQAPINDFHPTGTAGVVPVVAPSTSPTKGRPSTKCLTWSALALVLVCVVVAIVVPVAVIESRSNSDNSNTPQPLSQCTNFGFVFSRFSPDYSPPSSNSTASPVFYSSDALFITITCVSDSTIAHPPVTTPRTLYMGALVLLSASDLIPALQSASLTLLTHSSMSCYTGGDTNDQLVCGLPALMTPGRYSVSVAVGAVTVTGSLWYQMYSNAQPGLLTPWLALNLSLASPSSMLPALTTIATLSASILTNITQLVNVNVSSLRNMTVVTAPSAANLTQQLLNASSTPAVVSFFQGNLSAVEASVQLAISFVEAYAAQGYLAQSVEGITTTLTGMVSLQSSARPPVRVMLTAAEPSHGVSGFSEFYGVATKESVAEYLQRLKAEALSAVVCLATVGILQWLSVVPNPLVNYVSIAAALGFAVSLIAILLNGLHHLDEVQTLVLKSSNEVTYAMALSATPLFASPSLQCSTNIIPLSAQLESLGFTPNSVSWFPVLTDIENSLLSLQTILNNLIGSSVIGFLLQPFHIQETVNQFNSAYAALQQPAQPSSVELPDDPTVITVALSSSTHCQQVTSASSTLTYNCDCSKLQPLQATVTEEFTATLTQVLDWSVQQVTSFSSTLTDSAVHHGTYSYGGQCDSSICCCPAGSISVTLQYQPSSSTYFSTYGFALTGNNGQNNPTCAPSSSGSFSLAAPYTTASTDFGSVTFTANGNMFTAYVSAGGQDKCGFTGSLTQYS